MSVELQKSNTFNGPEVTIENICTEMAPMADNNIAISVRQFKIDKEIGCKCVIHVYLIIFDIRENIYYSEWHRSLIKLIIKRALLCLAFHYYIYYIILKKLYL